VEVLLPRSLDEALTMKAERPEAIPLAGAGFGRPPSSM